jgi:hypothetical protein
VVKLGINIMEAKRILTGFGDSKTCKLCIEVENFCPSCEWVKATGEVCCDSPDSPNTRTYDMIHEAKTPSSIKRAYMARAKYMRKVLKKIDCENRKMARNNLGLRVCYLHGVKYVLL